jgi:uncharacterized protein (DUF1778 family)
MKTQNKDSTVNIRVDNYSKNLIDQAASLLGQSRSFFILEAAKRYAEKITLDQNNFHLDQDSWEKFNSSLEMSPEENLNLRKLMKSKIKWT